MPCWGAYPIWSGASSRPPQQALTLMAFDPRRVAWAADNQQVRMEMSVRVAIYDGIWDAVGRDHYW